MVGKFISFGLGVAAGIWIAPKVAAFREGYEDVVDRVQEYLPEQPVQVEAPVEAAEVAYESPIEVEVLEPEDTTEFDAAVEAFLHSSASALEGSVA
jgi:hypothetical protein